MTTTVAQLIEHLKTLPQDAIVQVGREEQCGYAAYMIFDDLDTESTDIFGKSLVRLCAE